jgi:signal transduction histidine kinase/CheY-like chemotaxis protein
MFAFSCSSAGYPQPRAEFGVLNAENWFISKSNLELRGEWRFFWKQFLNPNEVDPKEVIFQSAGKHWTSIEREGKPLPSFGYGTYRLDIVLPDSHEPIAISVPVLHTAYRLYIDGELIYENGIVSEDESAHKPSFHTKILTIHNYKKILRIQLEVSNFTHKIAGMKEVIRIGRIDKIYASEARSYVINWLIILVLALLAFYHFAIYGLRKSEAASFYLGFLYLGILIVILTLPEGSILFNLFSDEWCVPLIRFSKIGLPISVAMGGQVLYLLFLNHRYLLILQVIKIYTTLNILVCLVAPLTYLGTWSYYFEFGTIGFFLLGAVFTLQALFQGKRDSFLYFSSLVLICTGAFVDILHNGNYLTNVLTLGYYNIMFFLIPQSYILTRSIIEIFRSEEKISRQLLKNNEELESKVNERTLELQKANRWKSNFVSLMSHDLRSPLIGVNQILDVLQFKFSTLRDEEKFKFLAMSKEGIQNSLRMLQSLLDVSRFDSDGIKLQQTKFSVKDLINSAVSFIVPIATMKDICISVSIEKDTQIIGDRALLEEVFKNILTNAIKFSFPGKSIEIQENTKGDWVSIQIKDYGLGMDEDMISKILGEANPKSQPGTNGELGTGLGLRLCVNILDAHFSKLRIQSQAGIGSTFEVLFSRQTRSILLVDDSDDYRSHLAEELRRNRWIVIEARNGEEALDHLARIKPDLIVTDKQMPIMDGISFLHEWEAVRGDIKIPLILISSDISLSDGEAYLVEEGLKQMVAQYLSKLMPLHRIVERISSYIG